MSKANPHFHRNNAPLPALSTPAYRVQPFYLVDNQICLFTIDYIMTSSSQSANSEANIAATWEVACLPGLRNALASDCFITAVRVTCLTTPSRIPFTLAVGSSSQAGLVSGNHLSSELAAIISKYTSTKGQHGRGRLYLPGIPTSFVTPATDANRLNVSGLNAVAALELDLIANTIADSANVALAAVTQRVAGGAPVTKGQPVTTLLARPLLGVIRRRRVGSGK